MTSISDETTSDVTNVGNALASLFEEPPPPPQTIRGFGKALQFHYGEPDLAGGQGEIIWESADILLSILSVLYKNEYWKNKSVLELGSGVGRLGLFFAAVGSNVILTDQPVIVNAPFLQQNICINNLQDQATIRELDWTQTTSGIYQEWIQPVDVVVASDCFFFSFLTKDFIQSLLAVSDEHTEIWLCNNGRWNKQDFFDKLSEYFIWYFVNPMDPSGKALPNSWETIGTEGRVVKCRRRIPQKVDMGDERLQVEKEN